ncbi:MAG: class I SAM-dependent methyltransferase [Gammaproteobacteria bacterium]
MDPIEKMKAAAREGWASFAPFEMITGTTAPELVRFAGVTAGTRVLDVGCGTGVVALTCARHGARVTGADLTPALLERARHNAALAGYAIDFDEADVEALPYAEASFDVVLSQFGHMFGPRPQVTLGEMLRVLKPGGTLAFSTWPPELYTGRMFLLIGKYAPPPPPGVGSPADWGTPEVVRARLGEAVRDLVFDRGCMRFPILSPAHMRMFTEQNAAPVTKLVAHLADEPERLAAFRAELEALVAEYFRDNIVYQDYLMTRAVRA